MRHILWISLVLTVIAHISGTLDDPDLWWHITIGRWIVAHGAVPVVDYWTQNGSGLPWRAYSWSIEVLFALVERYGGLTGLITLKILLTALLGFSAQFVFSRISTSLGMGSLLAVFYVASVYNHLTLRPQTFIWLIFIWVLYVAHRVSEHGPLRRYLVSAALLMSLWANIHLSAILGLGLMFCWIARRDNLRSAVVTSACGFLGTLVTPYLGGEWLTLASTGSHPFQFSSIAEFHPATILQHSTVFPFLLVVVIGLAVAARPTIQPLMRGFLALGFLIGALAVLKFLPFAMIILCGLIAAIWPRFEDKKSFPLFEGLERLIALFERAPREGMSFFLIAFAIVNFYEPFKQPLYSDITPVSTMDFFEKYQLPFPIMNSFGQGGYIMYRLADANGELMQKPSIDGRTNLITPGLWKMHMDAFEGRHDWKAYIDSVAPKTILWKSESPLVSILRNNSEWCHIYLAGDYTSGHAIFLARDEFEKRRDQLNADNCK
jgi:hypothetical protein